MVKESPRDGGVENEDGVDVSRNSPALRRKREREDATSPEHEPEEKQVKAEGTRGDDGPGGDEDYDPMMDVDEDDQANKGQERGKQGSDGDEGGSRRQDMSNERGGTGKGQGDDKERGNNKERGNGGTDPDSRGCQGEHVPDEQAQKQKARYDKFGRLRRPGGSSSSSSDEDDVGRRYGSNNRDNDRLEDRSAGQFGRDNYRDDSRYSGGGHDRRGQDTGGPQKREPGRGWQDDGMGCGRGAWRDDRGRGGGQGGWRGDRSMRDDCPRREGDGGRGPQEYPVERPYRGGPCGADNRQSRRPDFGGSRKGDDHYEGRRRPREEEGEDSRGSRGPPPPPPLMTRDTSDRAEERYPRDRDAGRPDRPDHRRREQVPEGGQRPRPECDSSEDRGDRSRSRDRARPMNSDRGDAGWHRLDNRSGPPRGPPGGPDQQYPGGQRPYDRGPRGGRGYDRVREGDGPGGRYADGRGGRHGVGPGGRHSGSRGGRFGDGPAGRYGDGPGGRHGDGQGGRYGDGANRMGADALADVPAGDSADIVRAMMGAPPAGAGTSIRPPTSYDNAAAAAAAIAAKLGRPGTPSSVGAQAASNGASGLTREEKVKLLWGKKREAVQGALDGQGLVSKPEADECSEDVDLGATVFGSNRWDTAEFQDKNARSRFQRLMGIKGEVAAAVGVSAPPPHSLTEEGIVRAPMTAEEQAKLLHDMEQGYEAALKRNLVGSLGLGCD